MPVNKLACRLPRNGVLQGGIHAYPGAYATPATGVIVHGFQSRAPQFAGEGLLFGVSAAGDRSNLETVTAGPILTARLVLLDNNTAQRSF